MWCTLWCVLLLTVLIQNTTSIVTVKTNSFLQQWCRYETLFPAEKGVKYERLNLADELQPNIDSTIRWFDATNRGITKLHTNTFENASQLVRLELSENHIRELDDFVFSEALNLRRLTLATNGLSTISERAFHNLHKLEYLDLYENNITSLPQNVFESLTSLRMLLFAYNPITSLPSDLFKSNKNLVLLFLPYNKLHTLPPDLFVNQNQLELLYLEHNPISYLPETVFDPLKGIEDIFVDQEMLDTFGYISPKIRVFPPWCSFEFDKYNGRNFIDKTVLNLGNRNIYELIAYENGITRVNISHPKLLNLRRLYLNANNLTSLGDIGNISSLEVLDLSHNPLRELNSDDFSQLKSLRELNLSATGINHLQPEIFAHLPVLQRLDLSNNGIEHLEPNSLPALPVEILLDGNPLKEADYNKFRRRVPIPDPSGTKLNCSNMAELSWSKPSVDTLLQEISCIKVEIEQTKQSVYVLFLAQGASDHTFNANISSVATQFENKLQRIQTTLESTIENNSETINTSLKKVNETVHFINVNLQQVNNSISDLRSIQREWNQSLNSQLMNEMTPYDKQLRIMQQNLTMVHNKIVEIDEQLVWKRKLFYALMSTFVLILGVALVSAYIYWRRKSCVRLGYSRNQMSLDDSNKLLELAV